MSMIHGVIRFDGRQSDSLSLGPMLAAGKAACPDGTETWIGGGAALGFGLLRTLPQARTATGPVRDPESGLVIVADARIDNRDELWGKLSVRDGRRLSDAQLLLFAFRKWGEHCVEHLAGDFAFAVWNEAKRELYCARDIFGVNPLYYFHTEGSFVFSSAVPSLLALEEIPRELDEFSIADTLAGLSLEQGRTLYRGIAPLPPAHCMTVANGAISLRRYWQPPPGNTIEFRKDEEYVDAYRELLKESIACRLETDGAVAGLLSGGLDSGAIAAIAAGMLAGKEREYLTWSFVLAEDQKPHERDERELIELMHGMAGIKGHFITTRDFRGSAADLYKGEREHLFLGNSPHLAALLASLADSGARVLLDGYGGDQCPTCGRDIPLQEFLDGMQIASLTKYLYASSRFHGCSSVRILARLLQSHLRTSSSMDVDEIVFARSVLSREFLERIDIRQRAQDNWRFQKSRFHSMHDIMAHRLQDRKGLQHYPRFSEHRVERRFPFFDKRLVEFSLSVPSAQHNFGMNRRLIRRAMAGILPEAIRLGTDKSMNNAPGALSFLNAHREYYIAMIDAARHESIASYIDLEKLRKRFAEALPAKFSGTAKADFMPGPTLRAFNMLQFLQKHAE